MKITGARNDPYPQLRRRVSADGVGVAGQGRAAGDSANFLGIGETELTASVREALQTLLAEIEGLREEVAKLRSRLADSEGLADRDPLVPLLNRRAFVRELARTAAAAERYGSAASLVYFDLDGFKRVNDRFGHAAGDTALKAVAERLSALVRESDLVGRMGGDEFAVILSHASREQAEAKAASLALAVAAEPVAFVDGGATLRMSWGVREISAGADPEALISEADAAMYVRKRARAAG